MSRLLCEIVGLYYSSRVVYYLWELELIMGTLKYLH